MKLRNKNILVTGAEGFIGSHLVERLVSEGANVNALVNYNFNNSIGNLKYLENKNLNKIDIFFGDLRDLHSIEKAFNNIDIVFNLAALIGIPYSYLAARSYFEVNTLGLMNILEISKKLSLEKIIHTSTSEVYGTAQYTPMDEKHPINSQSPYAASKSAADQLALSYYTSFNTPVVIIRPFNTYGPRQSERAFIPTVIYQMLKLS